MSSNSSDRTIVIAMMIALAVALLVVFSACTSGTGPAQQGPGIEVDVDHHKKTPKVQTKKPGAGFFGGSSSRSTRRK